jgi:sialic acid synthase SpsE/sugar phosphate isomerase/epimerase
MIIERQFDNFVIDASASVNEALARITKNQSRFVVLLSPYGGVEGVLTDGDFRRWVATERDIDLSRPVAAICNRQFVTAASGTSPDALLAMMSDKIQFLPLVDAQGRLVAIARRDAPDCMVIAGQRIDAESPAFIIAEIGINHNGDLALAKRLIDAAAEAGADCAKFQMRDMDSLFVDGGKADNPSTDLGAQYTLDVLSRSQLTVAQMEEAFDYCRSRGVIPMCTPWDLRSLTRLAAYGMPAYKIASADLTNHDLLKAVAATGRPIILSTGMSTEAEIIESCNTLRHAGAVFAILHCNSTYPAPFKDVHLKYMGRLKKLSGTMVGYSGHERGYAVPVAAVALGARIIEKHITLDRAMIGNDHKVSLEPGEFRDMVEAIRNVEEAIGDIQPRRISAGERMNREVLAKSLVANVTIELGATIDAAMIGVKSPGKGLQPNLRPALIGMRAKRQIEAGDFFYPSDLDKHDVVARPYTFKRPWGVPVRFHDWRALHKGLPMDFLEFHFSYKDLEANLSQFFDGHVPTGLVTHSPDLFANDHIMNLAADDEEYRAISIGHLQRAIDVTRALRQWFSGEGRIPIIASLGGMSREAPLPVHERSKLYDRIADSLSRLDLEGVELMPQTLPPFPWYLGGQLYCNLFVDPEDTAAFCKAHGLRLCFDISHSKLAANERKRHFSEYIDLLAPLAGHLHVVDATGVDGEGIQIGEGEVDFVELGRKLQLLAPGVSFIPEIWQGHKNAGEGFWIALERLESLL